MLASTVQFSSYGRPHPHNPRTPQGLPVVRTRYHDQPAAPSGPNSVPTTHPHTRPAPSNHHPTTEMDGVPGPARTDADLHRCSTHEHHPQHTRPGHGPHHHQPPTGQPAARELLRKEVIQPHLPVRLPCYDLVPIASPTFDGSPHKGWATGFGCYRLS